MNAFVSTTFAPNGSSVVDVARKLKSQGVENIELGSIHCPEPQLKEKLVDLGGQYLTHNFFPPKKQRLILNIASTDKSLQRQSVDFIKEAIDFSESIGATVYTFHPGFLNQPVAESKSDGYYDFEFQAKDSADLKKQYKAHFDSFLESVKEIDSFLDGKNVKGAIETQGSVSKKEYLLLARPDEFQSLFERVKLRNTGINLNLGHLNLAANAWDFDRKEFVKKIKEAIIAVEVSHNEGVDDDHAALKESGWYWDILRDPYFEPVPVIFEGRNITIEDAIESYKMINRLNALT